MTELEKKFDKMLNLFEGKTKIKNQLTVTVASGDVLDFPDVETGEMPSVGDVATFEGSPAEGDYLLPDGRTMVFVSGELTEIREVEEEEQSSEEMENQAKEIETLKADNEEIKNQLKSTLEVIKDMNTNIVNMSKKMGSNFSFKNQNTKTSKDTEGKKQDKLTITRKK